jgi:tetratricopeptide (TPR) repeat protein
VEGKPELLHIPQADSPLVLSEVRSSLIARARKDAATLLANEFGLEAGIPAGRSAHSVSGVIPADEWCRRGEELFRNGDKVKAVECFLTGLKEDPNHVRLQRWVALAYKTGRWGVVQNEAEAARLYRNAAEQGDPRAQVALGLMFEVGQGVGTDYTQALFYYRKAADQGHVSALHSLGTMYERGFGVKKDLCEAATYYRMAAEQGYAAAQLALSWMYKQGLGVPQNDLEAAYWQRRFDSAMDAIENDIRPPSII